MYYRRAHSCSRIKLRCKGFIPKRLATRSYNKKIRCKNPGLSWDYWKTFILWIKIVCDSNRKAEEISLHWSQVQFEVSRFVTALIPNYRDATDVVQQVALVAVKKFDHFESERSFRDWVMGIARYEIQTIPEIPFSSYLERGSLGARFPGHQTAAIGAFPDIDDHRLPGKSLFLLEHVCATDLGT